MAEVVVTLSDSDESETGGGVGLALGCVTGPSRHRNQRAASGQRTMSESESTDLVSDSTTWREGVALGTVARGGVGAGFVVGVAKRHGSWCPAQSPLELALARSWPALRTAREVAV